MFFKPSKTGFDPAKNWHYGLEICVFVFWANSLVQEATQLSNESGKSFWGKLVQHFQYSKFSTSFIFNYVDLIIVVTSVSAFLFRLIVVGSLAEGQLADPLTAFILHNLYVLNFTSYTIRLLQVGRILYRYIGLKMI